MISYDYVCEECGWVEERLVDSVEDRDSYCGLPCTSCGSTSTIRPPASAGFTVPEGGCGNAANGYSSYHGDSEIFKARGTDREAKVRKEYGDYK